MINQPDEQVIREREICACCQEVTLALGRLNLALRQLRRDHDVNAIARDLDEAEEALQALAAAIQRLQ